MNLPDIGSSVEIESWEKKGYVSMLTKSIKVKFPEDKIHVDNFGEGGATSRDILKIIRNNTHQETTYDLIFFGCGINDIWRKYQGRTDEAVSSEEYENNIKLAISLLKKISHHICLVNETPVRIDDYENINNELQNYNEISKKIAIEDSLHYIDLFSEFQQYDYIKSKVHNDFNSLWSDGVHLSIVGDELIYQVIMKYINDSNICKTIRSYKRYSSNKSSIIYKNI